MAKNKKSKKPIKRKKRPEPLLDPNGIDVPFPELTSLPVDELEHDSYYEVLQMHPSFKKMLEAHGEELPDQAYKGNGESWNPLMHLQIHTVIENQFKMDQPAGIRELAEQYAQEGILGTHEIRHVLMHALANEIWEIQSSKQPTVAARYLQLVRDSYVEWIR